MTVSPHDPSWQATENWDRLGFWWDEHKEGTEGSRLHRELVAPVAQELLGVQQGERVLDVACGNGQFSRRLASLGASVVAFDVSNSLIERAQARTTQPGHQIQYRLADATDETQILAVDPGPFDAAVANMVLSALSDIDPVFRALSKRLRPGGRFVITDHHPCFGHLLTPRSGRTPQANPRQRVARASGKAPFTTHLSRRAKNLSPSRLRTALAPRYRAYRSARHNAHYLETSARSSVVLREQPLPVWLFHRPLHALLGAAFEAGFVLDGLAEPVWVDSSGPPPVLAARLRL